MTEDKNIAMIGIEKELKNNVSFINEGRDIFALDFSGPSKKFYVKIYQKDIKVK